MNNYKRMITFSVIVLFTTAISLMMMISRNDVKLTGESPILESALWFNDVYIEQSRYNPGEEVNILAELTNSSNKIRKGEVIFLIKHLGNEVTRLESTSFEIVNGESHKVTLTWMPPQDDYKGYLIEAWFISNKEIMDKMNSAIDVSSDWSKYPRYGYLSNFGALSKEEIQNVIERLNRYHINGLQFYDWQYKHHQPLAGTVKHPEMKWKEIANRDVYFDTVKEYIAQAHEKNMMAMNYNLLFGSYNLSEKDGVKPEWGLYKDPKHKIQDGHPLPKTWATSKILLENPINREWQDYIIDNEKDVFEIFPFDGWHVDQLGDRGRLYDYDGNIITLHETFAPFLNDVKDQMDIRLVMNAVNDYGQIPISKTPVDFLYTEVWPSSFSSYGQIKSVIDRGYKLTNGEKNMVLAAYMNYKKADKPGEFNKPSVLLTNAVIFASGGAHIELGDTGMLGKEYFPNDNLKMSEDLERELKSYYHFLVAYQNILRDQVKPLNRVIELAGIEASSSPKQGSVWYFAKEKEGLEIVHLINLTANKSLQWRDDFGDYEEPQVAKDIKVKYYTDLEVEEVKLASPDFDQGSSIVLPFVQDRDEQGAYIELTLPFIKYWDMLYFTVGNERVGE